MAITAAIRYIELSDPSNWEIQDTTPYAGSGPDSQGTFTSRTLTILTADNGALPGYTNPIPFPFSRGNTLLLSGFTQDYALQATITLVSSAPVVGSAYTATILFATNRFLEQGLFNIAVVRLAELSFKANQIYRDNEIDILIEQSNSQTAVSYSNFSGSQAAIDRAQNIINNAVLQ